MKRFLCVLLAVLLPVLLTACNFTQNKSGILAGEAEATPQAEKLLLALAEGNTAAAKALLHPQTTETADTAIDQMSDFLSGRKVSALTTVSLNVSTSQGSSGATRQERVGYQLTLEDSTVLYLNAVYLSNNAGAGFISFQLVLGLV